jgi:(p)ppGpp synthase/HD superfamily hydrolase
VNSIDRAIAIALDAHADAKDKAGNPYILHPLRVMMSMDSTDAMCVGVLHDVVEDSHWTLERLSEAGFSKDVVAAVDCLTRRQNETYEAFIDRLKDNALARTVKIADIQDNMDTTRLKTVTEEDLKRLEKYHAALRVLATI